MLNCERSVMVDYQHSDTEGRLRNTNRIVVMGTTGAGKTTLAREIARALDMPHIELDYYRFRPNWVEVPNDEFRERVRKALRGDRWVADGNYGLARDVICLRGPFLLVWHPNGPVPYDSTSGRQCRLDRFERL